MNIVFLLFNIIITVNASAKRLTCKQECTIEFPVHNNMTVLDECKYSCDKRDQDNYDRVLIGVGATILCILLCMIMFISIQKMQEYKEKNKLRT